MSVTDAVSGQLNSRGVRHRTKAALNRTWPLTCTRFGLQCLACALTGGALNSRVERLTNTAALLTNRTRAESCGRLGRFKVATSHS